MTTLTIPAGERGVIRVFALSIPASEAGALIDSGPGRASLLGVDALPDRATEVVRIKDLEGVGLSGYLTQGHGAKASSVAQDRAKLEGLAGHVLLLFSDGEERHLTTDGRARLIGAYPQEGADMSAPPLESEAAKREQPDDPPTKKPMSDARMSGMVATAVLAFIALLVIVMVVIA
ncbi:MAG: hypothetical protein ACU0DW_09205 [Shimia sp.]